MSNIQNKGAIMAKEKKLVRTEAQNRENRRKFEGLQKAFACFSKSNAQNASKILEDLEALKAEEGITMPAPGSSSGT